MCTRRGKAVKYHVYLLNKFSAGMSSVWRHFLLEVRVDNPVSPVEEIIIIIPIYLRNLAEAKGKH
jgi:hypothetical protein